MGMVEIIKRAGLDAVNANNPVVILFGTVEREEPLLINVEQRFSIPRECLIIPELLSTHNEVGQAAHSLKLNDKVILLRMQGGQQYLILDRIVI